MAHLTARLERRVQADFPHQTDLVAARLEALGHTMSTAYSFDPDGNERFLAAVIIFAEGNLQRLDGACGCRQCRLPWSRLPEQENRILPWLMLLACVRSVAMTGR
ncbi:hypothetical protein AB0M46_15155 [Dactylosporangium sp. NPDC051485]|uniref:hypothetical protein n=1 Tax=Dactylosporangium sp. NPDC051485 TaxID=3154846 RepID=UPI0034421508